MRKPNYLLLFTIFILAAFVPLSILLQIELNDVRIKAIQKGYAEIVDGKFVWNDEIF
jgi:hypothetical protein